MKKVAKVIWWVVSIFLLIIGLALLPQISSFLFILAGLIALPPIMKLTSGFIKKQWIRVIVIILLFLIGCTATPDNNINNQPPKGSVIEKAPKNSK